MSNGLIDKDAVEFFGRNKGEYLLIRPYEKLVEDEGDCLRVRIH